MLTYWIYSAHAALSPWDGRNALDAAVVAYTSIGVLRQQIKPSHRVHAIIQGKDWAPNSENCHMNRPYLKSMLTRKPVIPDYSKLMCALLVLLCSSDQSCIVFIPEHPVKLRSDSLRLGFAHAASKHLIINVHIFLLIHE